MRISISGGIGYVSFAGTGWYSRTLLGATCEASLRKGGASDEGFQFYPTQPEELILLREDTSQPTRPWILIQIKRGDDGKFIASWHADSVSRLVGVGIRWVLNRHSGVLETADWGTRYTTDVDARADEGQRLMTLADPEDLLFFIAGKIDARALYERARRAPAQILYRHRLQLAEQELEAKGRWVRELLDERNELRSRIDELNGHLSRASIRKPTRADITARASLDQEAFEQGL